MKTKKVIILFICIIFLTILSLKINNVRSSFIDENFLLPSFKFNIGSKIVTITEHFKSMKGDLNLEYPIIKKDFNNNTEYFIAEEDIRTIFNLKGYNKMFVVNKEYETYWFAPDNQKYMHFKWKNDNKGNKVFEEPFIVNIQTKWGILPYEETFLKKDKEIKKTMFHIQSICSMLNYELSIDNKNDRITVKNYEGKIFTLTANIIKAEYEQLEGPIDFRYYLNSPIIISENRSMIDLQPLLFSDYFGLKNTSISNGQYKPYYWYIDYSFEDFRGKSGFFEYYLYSMPGKEKIWTNDTIQYDGKDIKWIAKPVILGKSRIEYFQTESNILVSLRTYFEMIGYKISWDHTNNEIIITP